MNIIENLFQNQKAYVGYLTVGSEGIAQTIEYANALIAGGVNILELGVPFSDPIADGPVIQRASERALQHQIQLSDILAVAKNIHEQHPQIPLILFSYFNPLLAAQPAKWLPQAKAAGIAGILVIDLPIEEGEAFFKACIAHQLAPIQVVTSVTSPERLKKILKFARGFLYYAAHKGTTGLRNALPIDFPQKITAIKKKSHLPIVAGFGIGDAQTVKQVLQYADGFVVGSYFMQAVEKNISAMELTQLAEKLL